ncbi:hypothetical protein PPERSA_06249 [Pseudocohnilembus persalinus]|uniref:RING-type domain-containing protein n=1 Tax=Pseudocohnilembus persalinus TaxID=266149 RepID=A0A0V0QVQ3_PSEPJ|nr:hypothetical protein PPERSA_06249 [Pseudocohnilembus persalinus]|eukprot:KRX06278.1 hypothetical protein PPERSA_06249 [Pseudocohnilembus persalinus]
MESSPDSYSKQKNHHDLRQLNQIIQNIEIEQQGLFNENQLFNDKNLDEIVQYDQIDNQQQQEEEEEIKSNFNDLRGKQFKNNNSNSSQKNKRKNKYFYNSSDSSQTSSQEISEQNSLSRYLDEKFNSDNIYNNEDDDDYDDEYDINQYNNDNNHNNNESNQNENLNLNQQEFQQENSEDFLNSQDNNETDSDEISFSSNENCSSKKKDKGKQLDLRDSHNVRNLEEIVTCFICMSRATNAMMCPNCSKMCCGSCINDVQIKRQWITEQKNECPHCRSFLTVNLLVNCRFASDINLALDNFTEKQNLLTKKQKNDDKCKEHDNKMKYFCKSCQTPICSDCAMFGQTHKGHEFDHLSKVYDAQMIIVNKEMKKLKKKQNTIFLNQQNYYYYLKQLIQVEGLNKLY